MTYLGFCASVSADKKSVSDGFETTNLPVHKAIFSNTEEAIAARAKPLNKSFLDCCMSHSLAW